MRHCFVYAFTACILLCAPLVHGAKVVVLTAEPVAEFTLPDGSVLRNAFAWRRNSEGIMIVHDDGQFFLNFGMLPDDWRKAYEVDASVEQVTLGSNKRPDQYSIFPLLERIKGLSHGAVIYFESKDYPGDTDALLLASCALQALRDGNLDAAVRLNSLLEEHFSKDRRPDFKSFYLVCDACSGSGVISRVCRDCDGSGTCKTCGGTGEIESQFINADSLHCNHCRGEGSCLNCQGTGKLVYRCSPCIGRGRILQKELLQKAMADHVAQLNRISLEKAAQ